MRLNLRTRSLSAAAALALVLNMSLPVSAVDPLASGGFAEVLISAQETDIPQESLQLDVYQRDSSGTFQKTSDLNFTTPVNRVTKDVELHLIPQTQQVTLTVDYLTDLNQDGVYEFLSDENNPVGDVLASSGTLFAATSGVSTSLTTGATYTLDAKSLLSHGRVISQAETEERLMAVTAEEIQEFLDRYLDMGQMSLYVMGNI